MPGLRGVPAVCPPWVRLMLAMSSLWICRMLSKHCLPCARRMPAVRREFAVCLPWVRCKPASSKPFAVRNKFNHTAIVLECTNSMHNCSSSSEDRASHNGPLAHSFEIIFSEKCILFFKRELHDHVALSKRIDSLGELHEPLEESLAKNRTQPRWPGHLLESSAFSPNLFEKLQRKMYLENLDFYVFGLIFFKRSQIRLRITSDSLQNL